MGYRQTLAVLSILVLCASCASDPTATPDLRVRIGFGIGSSAAASGVDVLAEILYAEPLVAHDWTGNPTGRLVEAWAWDEAGKTLILRIKKGVYFHDGSALTPQAVAQFLKTRARERRFGFRHVLEVAEADAYSVRIRLAQPDLFLLPELSEIKLTHPQNRDIGTGPFKLISRKPVVKVERFDRYHGGESALQGVTIQTFETQRAAVAALMREEVDVVQEVNRESIEFLKGSNVNTYPSVQPFYIPILFNVRHPALKHVEVRRAISEAVDRQAILERVMLGRGRIADGPLWPFHWAYPASSPSYAPNLSSASARLDSAGFPLPPGKTGELKKRFAFRCLVYGEDPQFERIALLAQRQLFDVGISMEIELVDLDSFGKRAATGDYDALLIRMQAGRAMDYTYRMWRSGADHAVALNSGYTGVDALLDELRRSHSEVETRRVVAALAKQFHDDAPAVFIAWTEVTRAVRSGLDVGNTRGQDPFFNMWQWRPREATASR